APVVAVSLMSLDVTRTYLTQLSIPNNSTMVTMPPENAFQAVEDEVVAYLERHTMAEFYQSRYYVLVDILQDMQSVKEFIQDYFHMSFKGKSTCTNPMCVVEGYKPVTPLSLSVSQRKEKEMEREGDNDPEGEGEGEGDGYTLGGGALPLSSIVSTLESMAHNEANFLSQTDRDALIFAHFIVSSYGEVDVTDCTPMLQASHTPAPATPSAQPTPSPAPTGLSAIARTDSSVGRTQIRKTRNERDFVREVFTAFEGPSTSLSRSPPGPGGERETEWRLETPQREISIDRAYDAMPESERERERENGIFRWATEEFVAAPVPRVFPLPHHPISLVWTPNWDVFSVFPAKDEELVECISGVPRSASYAALPTVVDSAMEELGLYDRLRVSRRQLWYCVCTIQQAYSSENPYHNATHATDVSHMAVTMAIAMLRQNPHVFGPLEMFALILACASHDVEHPGFDNKYLCRTRHPIAVRFNNQSVLENHHAHLGWGLIKASSVIEHFTHDDRQILRRLFVVLQEEP
ncbi:3'5'-cyclic nucleotide phosphodiesterase, partial [Kipferlia bialata]